MKIKHHHAKRTIKPHIGIGAFLVTVCIVVIVLVVQKNTNIKGSSTDDQCIRIGTCNEWNPCCSGLKCMPFYKSTDGMCVPDQTVKPASK